MDHEPIGRVEYGQDKREQQRQCDERVTDISDKFEVVGEAHDKLNGRFDWLVALIVLSTVTLHGSVLSMRDRVIPGLIKVQAAEQESPSVGAQSGEDGEPREELDVANTLTAEAE